MKENFEMRYDFIAKDGSRHQDMDSVKIANGIFGESMNERVLKAILRTQFKKKFELATYEMTMMKIYFKNWVSYCTLLMEAVNSGVVSKHDIKTFAHSLRGASVRTITIPEHKEYLRIIKELDLLIDTINHEQGQTRR